MVPPEGWLRDLGSANLRVYSHAFGQAGDTARIQELWREMEKRGVRRSAITLGCLTQAFVTNGESEEAWQLFDKQFNIIRAVPAGALQNAMELYT